MFVLIDLSNLKLTDEHTQIPAVADRWLSQRGQSLCKELTGAGFLLQILWQIPCLRCSGNPLGLTITFQVGQRCLIKHYIWPERHLSRSARFIWAFIRQLDLVICCCQIDLVLGGNLTGSHVLRWLSLGIAKVSDQNSGLQIQPLHMCPLFCSSITLVFLCSTAVLL